MAQKALLVGGCPHPFHHLEPVESPLRSLLEGQGFDLTVTGIYHPDGKPEWTGDYSALTSESLAPYQLLVLYTTGNEPHGADPEAVIRFVEGGGALVGIHNAADTFTNEPHFVSLIGGRFRFHPAQLDIAAEPTDAAHPIWQGVEPFTVKDELYCFADYDPAKVHLLAQTTSYPEESPTPVAWTREQGAGRVFYLSLGHNPSTMENPMWMRFLANGVAWATRQL